MKAVLGYLALGVATFGVLASVAYGLRSWWESRQIRNGRLAFHPRMRG